MSAVTEVASNAQGDDHVDQALTQYLSLEAPKSFFLFAGAGSGKTRSLVSALRHLAETYRETLQLRARHVAVITYTNAACDEIVRRTGHDPLFVVRTIHSFAWLQIAGFNADIRAWLKINLQEEISKLKAEEAKGRAGTKASVARAVQIESKQSRVSRLDEIKTFTYNPSGDNREGNALSHSEVIKIFASFIVDKPLMQRMFVEKFPFLLIDESQDTSRALIDALFTLQGAHADRFCLGLIGDTMQRIYPDGKARIEEQIPETWAKPQKHLNHRCPQRIVRLINRIRAAADTHEQQARDDFPEGWARLFVFPAETPDKPALEGHVRSYMAELTGDPDWKDIARCKVLALEHQMAARRMGFLSMFEALASIEEFRTAFLDGSFAPTRLFTHCVLPLVKAERNGDKFAAARLVRENSPLLSKDALKLSGDSLGRLRSAQAAVDSLIALWSEGEPSCAAIARNIAASGLFVVPDSLTEAMAATRAPLSGAPGAEEADPVDKRLAALIAFLECPFTEIPPYAAYVAGDAPFDTHQGVKGLEFDRVMVLMDDGEAKGFLFGYDKLLGAKAATTADLANSRAGNETSVDRTRRLFYVTCSRARSSLALVAYTSDPGAMRAYVVAQGWFREDEVVMNLPRDGST